VLIEWDPPSSAYWSFQLGDVWSRPLDFAHHQTDVNMVRAAIDADGRVRVVIALEDPSVANWLDPCGHTEGTVVVRNCRSVGATLEPSIRRIKVAGITRGTPSGPGLSRRPCSARRCSTR
jgi:hypothetical protein